MTRKSYSDLQEELREAQRYIWELIHDDTYAVINPKAYPHEYARIRHVTRYIAMLSLPVDHNPNQVKRALHVRHPGVLLLARPTSDPIFVCLLATDPESWCARVRSALNKYEQAHALTYIPSTGNPSRDYLTLLELVRLNADPNNLFEEVT